METTFWPAVFILHFLQNKKVRSRSYARKTHSSCCATQPHYQDKLSPQHVKREPAFLPESKNTCCATPLGKYSVVWQVYDSTLKEYLQQKSREFSEAKKSLPLRGEGAERSEADEVEALFADVSRWWQIKQRLHLISLPCRVGRCFCLRQRCPPDTRTPREAFALSFGCTLFEKEP
ncbi:MAG: hypothetical protein IJU96_00850 [Clostridia bacterium]|nr:hypothetical protein [Clostridia bacterium]